MNELAFQQSTDDGLRELALFAGAGGGILGGKLLGWRTVCAVEWEPYPASVLIQRQNDGILPPFPIWDDVRTFDGTAWRGRVDVVSGGFPCQDISSAGKGAGIDGERSGMWASMSRIIGEVRPRYAFVENSPMLTSRGLGRVLGDLAALGYDARWCVLGANDVGAPHQRDRIWIVANARCGRCSESECGEMEQSRGAEVECSGSALAYADSLAQRIESISIGRSGDTSVVGSDGGAESMAHPYGAQREGDQREERGGEKYSDFSKPSWWVIEPNVGRVVDRMAARVDRLKAIGNGQVSCVAAQAWQILTA